MGDVIVIAVYGGENTALGGPGGGGVMGVPTTKLTSDGVSVSENKVFHTLPEIITSPFIRIYTYIILFTIHLKYGSSLYIIYSFNCINMSLSVIYVCVYFAGPSYLCLTCGTANHAGAP